MKKWLYSVVGVFVLVFGLVPFIVGLFVQDALAQLLKQVNQHNYELKDFKIISFKRGWYSSEATIQFRSKSPHTKRDDESIDLKSIDRFTKQKTIQLRHGPYPIGVKYWRWSPSFAQAVLFDHKHFNISAIVGFSGRFQLLAKNIKPFETPAPKNAIATQVQKIHRVSVRLAFDSDGKLAHYQFNARQVVYYHFGLIIRLRNLRISARRKLSPEKHRFEYKRLFVEGLSIDINNSNGQFKNHFHLTGLDVQVKPSFKPQRVAFRLSIRAKNIMLNDFHVGDLWIPIVVENIETAVADKKLNINRLMITYITNLFSVDKSSSIKELFRLNPSLSIPMAVLGQPKAKLRLKLSLNVDYTKLGQAFDLKNASTLAVSLTANQAFIEKLLQAWAALQAKINKQNPPGPSPFIALWIKMGVLVKDGKNLKLNYQLKNQVQTLNGKQL